MELVEELADRSLSLEVYGETTNTMANMGIAYLMLGDQSRAIAALEAALERADEFAEAEASFFLADIYQRQGNHALAEEYANRAQEAGGYEAPDWYGSVAQSPKTKLPLNQQTANPEALSPRAKFCTQCGTAFETEDSNLCSSCGTRRG
jgi:tetratricopeptide (TPR) repeat protein